MMFNRSLFDRCASLHLAETTLRPRPRRPQPLLSRTLSFLVGLICAAVLFYLA